MFEATGYSEALWASCLGQTRSLAASQWRGQPAGGWRGDRRSTRDSAERPVTEHLVSMISDDRRSALCLPRGRFFLASMRSTLAMSAALVPRMRRVSWASAEPTVGKADY